MADLPRSQVWQWIRHPKGVLSDGRKVTVELFRSLLAEEMDKIKALVGEKFFAEGKYQLIYYFIVLKLTYQNSLNPIFTD